MFRNRRQFIERLAILGSLALFLPNKLLAFGRRRRTCYSTPVDGRYGQWVPQYPNKPDGSGNPQVALVKTDDTSYSICVRGQYTKPSGTTLLAFKAFVFNDASQMSPPDPNTSGVAINPVLGQSYNYDFSAANAISGVACGKTNYESVVRIWLFAQIQISGGSPYWDQPYTYKFKGQCSNQTDCG
jgi:hypothetical protein